MSKTIDEARAFNSPDDEIHHEAPPPPPGNGAGYRSAQRIGLFAGAAIFLLMMLVPGPEALSPEGWRTAGVAILMAIWWMTEAIPIPATALLPLLLFPTLGILPMSGAAAPYAGRSRPY